MPTISGLPKSSVRLTLRRFLCCRLCRPALRSWRRRLLSPLRGLLELLFALLLRLCSLGICHISENLQPPRLLLCRKYPVVLVDCHSHQCLELPRKLPMPGSDERQQLPFAIENLQSVFHLVRHPDVPVSVYRNSLWP